MATSQYNRLTPSLVHSAQRLIHSAKLTTGASQKKRRTRKQNGTETMAAPESVMKWAKL